MQVANTIQDVTDIHAVYSADLLLYLCASLQIIHGLIEFPVVQLNLSKHHQDIGKLNRGTVFTPLQIYIPLVALNAFALIAFLLPLSQNVTLQPEQDGIVLKLFIRKDCDDVPSYRYVTVLKVEHDFVLFPHLLPETFVHLVRVTSLDYSLDLIDARLYLPVLVIPFQLVTCALYILRLQVMLLK